MKTGIKGVNLIKEFEGLRLHAYYDSVGVLTIGYGHTNNTASASTYPVYPGESITENQATTILQADLVTYESAVNNAVTRQITQNQFDALVSFTYNLGAGTLYSSDLLKYVNAGNFNAAANEFQYYCHGGGQVLPGLVRRRAAERALFLDGSSDNAPDQKISAAQAIDKMIGWMKDRLGKVTYSMTYRNGPNSYDCSSAVYHALVAGGFLPEGSNGNTDSEFGALERNGWSIVPKDSNGHVHAIRGDIFIWGNRGASTGAFGHTGIFYDNDNNIIHCNYGYNGITINNYDNIWTYNNKPTATIYRYNGNNLIPTHNSNPDVTPATGTYTFNQTTNIRTAPSTSASIVGQYTAGQSVVYNGVTYAEGYTWLQYTSYSGSTLYVAEIGGTNSSSTGKSNVTPDSGTYVFSQTTNIRTAPSTSAAIVGQYQVGESVTYNGKVDAEGYTWLRYVAYSGRTLYVAKITGSDTTASTTPDSGSYTFNQTTNIRTAPSTSAEIVGQYQAGQSVSYNGKVTAEGYTWLRYVAYSGRTLYVAEIGGSDSTPKGSSNVTPAYGTYVFTQTTNIRTAPSTNAGIAGQFQAGDSVNYNGLVSAEGYNWLQYTSYSGKTLYAVK